MSSFSASPAFCGFNNSNATASTSDSQSSSSDYYSAGDAPATLNANQGGRFNNSSKTEQKLMDNIRHRDMRGIEKSIAYGASVVTSAYKSDPPIMVAIDCGFKDIVKLLLDHKQLDINERARNGHTPLGYACSLGKTEIVSVLLKSKAHINAPDGYGDPPLVKAIGSGHNNVSELLLKKGANVNAQNSAGNTALHTAVTKSSLNLIKLLLKQKSLDMSIKNKNNLTAPELLNQHPDAEIKHLLESDSKYK